MPANWPLYIAVAVILAVLLDLWLIRWLRGYLRRRGVFEKLEGQGVFILGAFSPLLTWLKRGRLLDLIMPVNSAIHPPPATGSSASGYPVRDRQDSLKVEDELAGRLSWRVALLDCSLIAVAVLLYCSVFLDLGKATRLPGNESEILQTLDWTLVNSLSHYRVFPLWNPYLHTGLPYIADPMLHAYNPLSTIPVLLFGVRDGFKIGIFLSFLAAAWGMWWLGGALGMGRAARFWVALMYAFAGQPAARFFQGQYLFVLGFAWIPWVVGGLFRLTQTRRRLYLAGTTFAVALLIFSGNIYYSLYTLALIALFTLVMLVRWSVAKPIVRIDVGMVSRLLSVGVLAAGVSALQLLPLAEYWPRLSSSMEVTGSHTVQQIILDYTSKDVSRPDAFNVLPAREEFYAYIGAIPFLALILLPLAWKKRDRRALLFLGLLLLFVVLWINLQWMPWYETFLQAHFFSQFRHLLRILIYGSFAIILLAGLGLDTLWKSLESTISEQATGWARARSYAAAVGITGLAIFMVLGVSDVYQTNRGLLKTQPIHMPVYRVTEWLRQMDGSDFYVRLNPNNASQDAVVSADLRFIDSWYHLNDIRSFEQMVNWRPVQAYPNYVIQNANDPAPGLARTERIAQVEGYDVYRLLDSLPYVFSVSNERISRGDSELQRADVEALTPFASPNRIEVIASGWGNDTLIVLTSNYPGWEVSIDEQAYRLQNAGGYLAAPLQPGAHRYVFSFRPRVFFYGLLISVTFTALSLYLLFSDLRTNWREASRRLRLTLESWSEALPAQQLALRRWLWATPDRLRTLFSAISLEMALFVAALGVYAFTRLYALESFPIYFFGDEAVQTLFAERLIARGFHDANGTFLPVYVEAAGLRWTPLLSMYFHALTLTLFGKSILVTRATSAVVSILGAGAIALILKQVFKARYWWAGALLVAATPAWFLHSRTAFETVMTAAFYGCFLLFYMRYLEKSPRYLYAAAVFGAATFYTYSNAQAVILAAAGLLLLSDFRYHLRHPAILLRTALLLVVLAYPFINFRMNEPGALSAHLRTVNSYWYGAASLGEKLSIYVQKYAFALSPQYWFIPNQHDLARHRMAGMGLIHLAVLPLFLIGLWVCLRRLRSSPHRALLLAAMATPVGAALVEVGITRVLAFIIPANILAGLGLEWVLQRLQRRVPYKLLATSIFMGLVLANFALLRTALIAGPLWFSDYGLYGMQYGARQLFEETIPEYLRQDPNVEFLVSSTWANGADNFIQFFFNSEERRRVRMDGIGNYIFKKLPLDRDMIFVMTQAEYDQALVSPKFQQVEVERLIPYPDGTPGFYFARLEYVGDVDQIFAAEQETRRQLVETEVEIDGQKMRLMHSQIDMGLPELMFDGDPYTLMRGVEANPFILDFYFSSPRPISGLQADFGLVDLAVTVQLYTRSEAEPLVYTQTLKKPTGDSSVYLPLDQSGQGYTRLRLEILNIFSGETANIHIRELDLLP